MTKTVELEERKFNDEVDLREFLGYVDTNVGEIVEEMKVGFSNKFIRFEEPSKNYKKSMYCPL